MFNSTIFSGIPFPGTCPDHERIKTITQLPEDLESIRETLRFFDKIEFCYALLTEAETVQIIGRKLLQSPLHIKTWAELVDIFEELNPSKYPGTLCFKNIPDQISHLARNGTDIRYLSNPAPELQIAAVRCYGQYIKHIKNQCQEAKLLSVRKDGNNIQYIADPGEEVQIEAVKNGHSIYKYIKNPSVSVQMAIATRGWDILEIDIDMPCEEAQLIAVSKYGKIIKRLIEKGPVSEAVKLAAVQQDGESIEHIPDPSEQVQIEAVTNNPEAIYCIKSPCERAQLKAVVESGYIKVESVIKYIIRSVGIPSEEVQMAAVKKDGMTIKHFKNPSEAVQLAAVKQNNAVIYHIDDPCLQIQQRKVVTDLLVNIISVVRAATINK
jgi:hypothetical protein